MIYEFAISPKLCTSYENVRLFLVTFGGERGRLLSDIPRKNWLRRALSEIKGSKNGPVGRSRLSAATKKLSKQAMYKRNTAPNSENEDWLDHAIAAHNNRPFKAIITDCYDGNNECVIKNDYDLIDNTRWKVPGDKTIERRPETMLEAIKPMLDCAREVILIDRNYRPELYRWPEFLIAIAKFLSGREFSPSINRINYHIGNNLNRKTGEWLADHPEKLDHNKLLSKELPKGIIVNFFIWPKEDLHDRFVLTDVGGVEFGIGLDIYDGSGPETVRISRISEETRLNWWKLCKSKQSDVGCEIEGTI
jgi:hypothetical protein